MKITRAPRGTDRREVDINQARIPDLWHLAMWLRDADGVRSNQGEFSRSVDLTLKAQADEVLECWHLCHDLRENIADPTLVINS